MSGGIALPTRLFASCLSGDRFGYFSLQKRCVEAYDLSCASTGKCYQGTFISPVLAAGIHFNFFGIKQWRSPMVRWQRIGLALVLSSSVIVGFSGAANSFTRTLNFCNKTNVKLDVAYGYEPAGSTNTQTKGWRNVHVCQCVTLFSEDVRATELYVYVTKEGSAATESFVNGRAPLCVRSAKFQVGPSNRSKERCNATGGHWVNFLQVNASKTNHTLNFGSGGNCRG
jgi:uncharacterized membrane protein